MLTATVEEEKIAEVPGFRFRTNARPGSAEERQLQHIQSDLSGGVVDLPSPPTVAHLNFYAVAVVNGPDASFISLWVPAEQEREATELLQTAGFVVT